MNTVPMFEPITLQSPVDEGRGGYLDIEAWKVGPGLAVGRPRDAWGNLSVRWVISHCGTGYWLTPAWSQPEAAVAAAVDLLTYGLDFEADEPPLSDVFDGWLDKHVALTDGLSPGIPTVVVR